MYNWGNLWHRMYPFEISVWILVKDTIGLLCIIFIALAVSFGMAMMFGGM